MNKNEQTISVPASADGFTMKIAHDGKEDLVRVDWSRWPYRYAVDDGPSGRRLTRRGTALAGIRAVQMRASSYRAFYLRALWLVDDVTQFAKRWYERDRAAFPHFVEEPPR